MEQFRTPVKVLPSGNKIGYQKSVFFLGSCFSENMGTKLAEAKFKVIINPFGIVYNPMSVKTCITRLLSGKPYEKSELFQYNDLCGSFDHHSRFSHPETDVCLQKINDEFNNAAKRLRDADFLFITFGTSYVYSLKSDQRIVSNCHKFPADIFEHTRLSVDEIVKEYKPLLETLFRSNTKLKVVFTVSPIRHWKDGAHENSLSKSILLLAVDKICSQFPDTFYFPSYEIMMDDLRDYRFYDEDMLHPNKIAISYIWNRFRECFMDHDTLTIMKEVEKVVQASNHKPFNTNTESFITFARQILDKIIFLRDQYSIDFVNEEQHFRSFV